MKLLIYTYVYNSSQYKYEARHQTNPQLEEYLLY